MSEEVPEHLQRKNESPREWAKRTGAYIDSEELEEYLKKEE